MIAQPTGVAEDIVERGKRVYDSIRPLVESNVGQYLVIDVDTGVWEMGEDSLALADRLHAHHPNASLYAVRIGYSATARIGRLLQLLSE